MNKGLSFLYTVDFVVGVLVNRKAIEESAYYSAGLEAIDVLMTLDRIIESANLTERQSQALNLYYCEQYTQEEVSEKMGISQQAVLHHLRNIRSKLRAVLKNFEGDMYV